MYNSFFDIDSKNIAIPEAITNKAIKPVIKF
jgi:hypothetical protein